MLLGDKGSFKTDCVLDKGPFKNDDAIGEKRSNYLLGHLSGPRRNPTDIHTYIHMHMYLRS